MPVRNQNWYNLQANRRYPLDERSTGVDDSGAVLRDSILVDCHIRFPSTLGQYLFVQGITVAPQLITVVFGAVDDLEDASPVTVAAVSLPRATAQSINHPITPLAEGVAGWVVFGGGLAEEFVGRYSAPLQTLLAPRCARPYRPLPVPTLGKLSLAASLQGEITLAAGPPVTAQEETVYVDSEPVQAIVFRLEETVDDPNPLKTFLGPCAQRPESGTCLKPPIETLNGVPPDCNGNINIVIEGFTSYAFDPAGGVDIVSDLGLAEACAALEGQRRRAAQDNCVPGSESLGDITWPDPLAPVGSPPFIIESESVDVTDWPGTCATLPLCYDFLAGAAADFVTKSGVFVFEEQSAPEICSDPEGSLSVLEPHYVMAAANVVGRNIALYKNCASDWALAATIGTQLKLTADGLARNGGLVFNYLSGYGGPTTYLVALIDADRNELRLLRFNGTAVIEEYSASLQTYLGQWYYLSVQPVAAGASVIVTVTAGAVDGTVPEVAFSVPITNYGNPIGQAGLYTNQAYTYFNQFTIEA